MTTPPLQPSFAAASRRAQLRLALAHGCRLLVSSGPWVFAPLALAVIAWRLTGHREREWPLALALALGWLAATATWVWNQRSLPFAALAAWDRAAGRKEAFASAYAFESTGAQTTLGEGLHLARMRQLLQDAFRQMARDLPVRLETRAWLPALLFVGFALTGLLRQPLPDEEKSLSAAARQRAAKTAGELNRKAALTDPFKGLTPEERAKAEALKAQLEQTAKKLEQLRQETPRDVLAELEKRAHEAEKLAASLSGDDLNGLSSDLISELEHNADTAEFGNALRENNLDKAAEEAKKLGARLGRKDLTLEERKRIEDALKRTMSAANNKDRQSALGHRLGQALSHMQAGQPGLAGQQFGSLSQQLAAAGQRRNAQSQLRQLASSLRAAGQQILGGQGQMLQQLPQGAAPGGLQALGSMPLQMGQLQLSPSSGAQGSLAMGMPGNMPPGAGSGQPPIPGMGAGSGNPMPGSGGFPMPGGGAGQGAMAGGGFPMPGGGAAAAGGPGAGGGGSQAGNGSVGYNPFITAPLAASKTGVVNAQPNGNGPSEVRSIEGQQHGESARRGAQEIAADFIKVEEQALNEEPLPLSRREQVLRYFTALRKQINQPDAAEGRP